MCHPVVTFGAIYMGGRASVRNGRRGTRAQALWVFRASIIDLPGVRMTAYAADTVTTMLRGADSAPAIWAPGRSPMTYGALRSLVDRTVASLKGIGVRRDDRIAIVLPNGPEMAAAFIAVLKPARNRHA